MFSLPLQNLKTPILSSCNNVYCNRNQNKGWSQLFCFFNRHFSCHLCGMCRGLQVSQQSMEFEDLSLIMVPTLWALDQGIVVEAEAPWQDWAVINQPAAPCHVARQFNMTAQHSNVGFTKIYLDFTKTFVSLKVNCWIGVEVKVSSMWSWRFFGCKPALKHTAEGALMNDSWCSLRPPLSRNWRESIQLIKWLAA